MGDGRRRIGAGGAADHAPAGVGRHGVGGGAARLARTARRRLQLRRCQPQQRRPRARYQRHGPHPVLRCRPRRGHRRAWCDHPRPLAPLHPLRLVAAGRAGNDGGIDRRRDRSQYSRQEQLRRRQFRRACRIVRASDRDRRGAALFARRAQRRVSWRDRRVWHARLLPRDHHAAQTRACRTAARLGHADARPGAQP